MNERTRDLPAELQRHLGWSDSFERLYGGRTLEGVELYADFNWFAKFGLNQKVFPNYKSLAKYVRRQGRPRRQLVLVLTDRETAEGRHPMPMGERDIFIINIDRYCQIAERDAAGAYFAGLAGSPTIGLDTPSLTPEVVNAWIGAHPGQWQSASSNYAGAKVDPLLHEVGRRIAAAVLRCSTRDAAISVSHGCSGSVRRAPRTWVSAPLST